MTDDSVSRGEIAIERIQEVARFKLWGAGGTYKWQREAIGVLIHIEFMKSEARHIDQVFFKTQDVLKNSAIWVTKHNE